MAGTETFGPAAEIAIMTSVEAAMAAAASQPVRRMSPGAAGRFTRAVLVASTPSLSRTKLPVYWSWSWLPHSRVRD